jgi:hypothetical protein
MSQVKIGCPSGCKGQFTLLSTTSPTAIFSSPGQKHDFVYINHEFVWFGIKSCVCVIHMNRTITWFDSKSCICRILTNHTNPWFHHNRMFTWFAKSHKHVVCDVSYHVNSRFQLSHKYAISAKSLQNQAIVSLQHRLDLDSRYGPKLPKVLSKPANTSSFCQQSNG